MKVLNVNWLSLDKHSNEHFNSKRNVNCHFFFLDTRTLEFHLCLFSMHKVIHPVRLAI